MAQWVKNPSIHEPVGSFPGLDSGLRIWHCRELRCRSQRQPGFCIGCGCGVGQQLQLRFNPWPENFFFSVFLGLNLRHMEVPRLGVESEL